MTGALCDGLLWQRGHCPWAVWADPPSVEPVLAGGAQESAVVSVWAGALESSDDVAHTRATTIRANLRPPRLDLELLGAGPVQEMGGEAPARFLAAPLDDEMGRLARAALRLGCALEASRTRPGAQPSPPAESELAALRSRGAAVARLLGASDLPPASAHRLSWLVTALERGAGVLEHSDVVFRYAFLIGPVTDAGWTSVAERVPFPVAWCVRQAPIASRHDDPPAAGIVAVGSGEADSLEARVGQLRAAYSDEGHVLVRPIDQPALAAAVAPWAKLPRRLWRDPRRLWREANRAELAGA